MTPENSRILHATCVDVDGRGLLITGASILVETDAPYLAPPPYRGKRNEPAYTAFTAQVGADVFGMAVSEFAAQTEANFERLFWKAA